MTEQDILDAIDKYGQEFVFELIKEMTNDLKKIVKNFHNGDYTDRKWLIDTVSSAKICVILLKRDFGFYVSTTLMDELELCFKDACEVESLVKYEVDRLKKRTGKKDDGDAYILEPLQSKRESISKFRRKIIYNASRGKCNFCGAPLNDDFHVDHIHPVSKWKDYDGENVNETKNLQALCKFCNMEKSDKTMEEFIEWRKRKGYALFR